MRKILFVLGIAFLVPLFWACGGDAKTTAFMNAVQNGDGKHSEK